MGCFSEFYSVWDCLVLKFCGETFLKEEVPSVMIDIILVCITVTLLMYCKMTHIITRNVCRCFNNLPTRSPDATPCDFFYGVYIKDQVYVPPLPSSIPELKVGIRTAIETITADMLQTVWNELDYRVDVCRITKGAHIEQL